MLGRRSTPPRTPGLRPFMLALASFLTTLRYAIHSIAASVRGAHRYTLARQHGADLFGLRFVAYMVFFLQMGPLTAAVSGRSVISTRAWETRL